MKDSGIDEFEVLWFLIGKQPNYFKFILGC